MWKDRTLCCWQGLKEMRLSKEGWLSTDCHLSQLCRWRIQHQHKCSCWEITFAKGWKKIVMLFEDFPAGFLGVTSQESSSVGTCQWMKGQQNAENVTIKLICNWVDWDAFPFLWGARLHPNPQTWHLYEVGQQKDQHISITRTDNNTRCLALDTVEHCVSLWVSAPLCQAFTSSVLTG